LSARNKRIELAALANLSCANDIPFESILRQNDVQNRFHTASVISGQTNRGLNPFDVRYCPKADKNRQN
jgi:hypothetical protein